MQNASPDLQSATFDEVLQPAQALFVAWDRQSSTAGYFTIGVSYIGSNAAIRGDGNNPAEADSYLYYDESDHVMTVEYDRQFNEPIYSTSRAIADITLENTDDRYTPGFDPVIGSYIIPQRPIKISMGYFTTNPAVPEMVQTFVGQIADVPVTDQQEKTITIHAIDFSQVLWDFPIAQTQLYQNKRTDELIIILLTQFGLSATKYSVDTGTVTIPYAFFQVGDTMGDIIEKITEAEQGSFYCDENGIFRFEARIKYLDSPRTRRKYLRVEITAYTSGDQRWMPPQAPVDDLTTYYYREFYRSNIVSKLIAEFEDSLGALTYASVQTGIPAYTGTGPNDYALLTASVTTPSDCVKMRVYHAIEAVGWLETDDYWLTLVENAVINSLIPNYSAELGTYATNSVSNPDFATNTTGYTAYTDNAEPAPTLAQDTSQGYTGLTSMSITVGTNTGLKGATYSLSGLTGSSPYTFILWAKGLIGGEQLSVNGGPLGRTISATLTTDWTPLIVSGTTGSGVTSGTVTISTTSANVQINVDYVQFYYGTCGTPTSWTTGGFGTNTAYQTWIDRGNSLVVADLSDDHVYDEQQLQADPGSNAIVNLVEIFANPRAPMSSNEVIFAIGAGDARVIEAGQTLEFYVNYADPLISNISPTAGGADSFFLGNTAFDGSGTDVTSSLTLVSFTNYAQSSKVDIENTSGSDLYLWQFQVTGKTAPVTQPIYVKVSDTTSIGKYQEQPIQITNDFIQTNDIATSIATKLVADRKDPARYITVTCKGIPYLQLGDIVSRNSNYYWVNRIKGKFTGTDGFTQQLTLVKRIVNP